MTVTAQLIGYPRIGPRRELKWALERAWSGQIERPDFESRTRELREQHLAEQRELVRSAVDDFFLYDEVLETAMMFGILPEHLAAVIGDDPFEVLTELARGTPDREAWEMTKWFDTNYHYVVAEVTGRIERFEPLPWRKPTDDPDVTWPVLGPFSLVKLSKLGSGVDAQRLATELGDAFWSWVHRTAKAGMPPRLQLDEPSLGVGLTDADRELLDAAYAGAANLPLDATPIVTIQFGRANAQTLLQLGRRGLAVQVPHERIAELRGTAGWDAQPELVVTAVDGRSVWPDSFASAETALRELADGDRALRLVPSTSLMFLPVTTEGEDLPAGFQFAREKARTLRQLADALSSGRPVPSAQLAAGAWPAVGELTVRAPRAERRAAQADLNLPPYPTTTTGSLPQTSEVRQYRVKRDRGEIDSAEYDRAMARLITDGIAWQERIGLDVLVHGEFERTDMVEYFAEKMDGFHTTRNGWVLSYGSRCVRAPILAAPPSISEPMTVREWQLAQSATDKPVKGMLTGPVTIVNWSFRPPGIPDDRLFWAVAGPIAEEVRHLVDAGARVIQVDEPAVRERWPLPTEDAPTLREVYARGVRAALNRVFDQPAHVQMHTHMCYGDFGDIVPLWSDAGVDVASIEFSRSKDDSYIRQFYALFGDGHLQIGPGVFDVHSPHTPGLDTMDERLRHFEQFMAIEDLWVNPDCGLKTRAWDEIERQLGDLVGAARHRRQAARSHGA
jgi:5-methyltetrahydropteroyltriglutamate--homocysteine methyltransferase